MKRKKVKLLTYWILGAVFVCYYSIGVAQATGAYSTNVNTLNHSRVLITRPKSGASRNLKSWLHVNHIDLPNSGGKKNIPEVNSTYHGDRKRKRVKRQSGKAPFECVTVTKKLTSVKKNSVGPCVEYCWENRNSLALLWKGDQCSCLNKNDPYTVVKISNCFKRCKDQIKQNCGGVNYFSKYETGYIKEPKFNKNTESELRRYEQGCFKMLKKSKQPRLETIRMQPHICLEFCSYEQNRFAALSGGNLCQCVRAGNGYFGATKESCSKPCLGDKKYNCGGKETVFLVYKSGYYSSQKKNSDKRFDDMSWAQPDRKDPREYAYFDMSRERVGGRGRIFKSSGEKTQGEKFDKKYSVVGIVSVLVLGVIFATYMKDRKEAKKRLAEKKWRKGQQMHNGAYGY